MIKTAMLFAAGRGERLKPLTNKCPKPLLPIHGKPLIDYHLEHLAKAGFQRVIINLSYLGGQIRHHINQSKSLGTEIIYVTEPPGGLETGGTIINQLNLIDENYFVTINADIFTDFPLASLHNIEMNHEGHLILVPKTTGFKGDFGLDKELLINDCREYLFSGIAIYHRHFFNDLKIGRFSVSPLLRQAAELKKISASLYKGMWHDIGDKKRYFELNKP